MSVHRFFSRGRVDLEGLSQYLDRLDSEVRIAEARSLTAGEQSLLYDAAEGFRPLTLNDFVPETLSPLHQVIHYGRNSLPAFRIFEKRFCRPYGKSSAEELWGYNEHPLRFLTGPGYFVVRRSGTREVVIDYCMVPPGKPRDWPTIVPNSARLGRFIYYRTQDFMRGVSAHVTVGRATRQSRPMNNWFVLCRGEPRK